MKKLLFIGILILAAASPFYLYNKGLTPIDPTSDVRKTVTISQGMGVGTIGDLLEEEGLIRSSRVFVKYAKKHELDTTLKAGTYVLQPSWSVEEMMSALTEGNSPEEKVTIPEGYTIIQIDALLAEKGFGEPGDIIHCAFTCDFSTFDFLPSQNFGNENRGYGAKLEGYLYPDTYFVSREEYVPKFLLERMLGTFRTRIINGLGDDIDQSKYDLHQLTTMASLIEEETRAADERAIVAGILWKRFDQNMGLGVDATVRYITQNITDPITREELATDSPYNTRKFAGLPPGPIANAGLASFEAALRPESSPYFYYLHGTDGQIRYAETNDEHNVNRAKYLR